MEIFKAASLLSNDYVLTSEMPSLNLDRRNMCYVAGSEGRWLGYESEANKHMHTGLGRLSRNINKVFDAQRVSPTKPTFLHPLFCFLKQ